MGQGKDGGVGLSYTDLLSVAARHTGNKPVVACRSCLDEEIDYARSATTHGRVVINGVEVDINNCTLITSGDQTCFFCEEGVALADDPDGT